MSAELLREAAALMRERAENSATGSVGPLTWTSDFAGSPDHLTSMHYQSWHPAVALAVADWLDDVAANLEAAGDEPLYDLDRFSIRFEDTTDGHALAVARAYLGREA